MTKAANYILTRIGNASPKTRAWLLGSGASLNFYPTRWRKTFAVSDSEAAESDWLAVGDDLRIAIKRHSRDGGRKVA